MTAPTPREIAAARTHARFTGRRRLPATKCPYNPAGDARQRALAGVWVASYLATNPAARAAVDHDEQR